MGAFKDLIGMTFGRLTVIEKDHSEPQRGWFWKCKCSCNGPDSDCVKNGSMLLKGEGHSCGCVFKETRATCHKTHGMSYSKEYKSYNDMLARCFNSNYKQYEDYGGRGITVCERWLGDDGFENFLADMGPKPEGLTLERQDTNGNYGPPNCIWASRKVQNRNRRNTHRYEYKGQQLTAGQISELTGVPEKTFIARVSRLNWDVETAADTPVNAKK